MNFVKSVNSELKEYRIVRKSDHKVSTKSWAKYPALFIKYNFCGDWRDRYDIVCYTYQGRDSKIVTR